MSWASRAKHLYRRFRDASIPEAELDEEIQFHFETIIERRMSQGLTREEAQRTARLDFGGRDQVKENVREAWTGAALESALRDLRYAFRMLRKSPGFTLVAVTMLALGIGVNSAVFTITNATLFKGFRLVNRNDRLLYIDTQINGAGCCVAYPDFQDWRAQAKSFQGMGAFADSAITLINKDGLPERHVASRVSANTLGLVSQKPILGRDFAPSDETRGAPLVAILTYGIWERRFGKDPAIIGQTLRISGFSGDGISTGDAPLTIIGVMAQGFSFPQNQDLWLPLIPTSNFSKREARFMWFVAGRLADGVTIESARAEMATIGKRLASVYSTTNRSVVPTVHNFPEFFFGRNAPTMYRAIWGAVGFVLLIACANLANLMLARTMARSREVSLRIALGAGRWRIIRQLLMESVMLSGMGGVLGWFIAKCGVTIYDLMAYAPRSTDSEIGVLDYSMDYHAFAYLIAISIGTGILFGLAPALRLSRLDINATLKDGGRSTTGGGRGKHLSFLLVTGEMALAVVLLAGAGVMIRSFLKIYTADVGAKTENVLAVFLRLPNSKYLSAETQISFYDRLKMRLETIPGVESVSIASEIPTGFAGRRPYELAGLPPVDEQRRPTLTALVIGPAYFQTLGSPVLAGREFNDADRVSGIPVVLVNARFASTYWPGEDPIGKRLRLFDGNKPQAWMTVVGIVSNIMQNDRTRQKSDPLIYIPYRQNPTAGMWVIARTRVAPSGLGTAFRRELQAMDSDLVFFYLATLAELLATNYWRLGLYGVLFLTFAAIALLLASIGLYTVIAHSVGERRQEIGIRMAIGGTARDIVKLVFMQGMLPVGIGLAIGLAASFAVNRLLKSMLVQISPFDPLTLVAASAVLIVSAMLGCWIPARREMRVDPVVALRHD